MRRSRLIRLGGILVLTLLALWVVWPQQPSRYLPGFIPWPQNPGIHLNLGSNSFDRQGFRLGLDLQGGTQLVLQADLSKIEQSGRANAMHGVVQIIDRRINAFGVSEPVIQQVGEDRVSVQLPGVKDTQEAVRLVGKTAQLDFREQVPGPDGSPIWQIAKAKGLDGQEKELNGQYFLPKSAVVFEQTTNRPQVAFEFNEEGAVMFEQLTQRLIGRPLGIFLDNELISAPTVQAVISNRGVITGLTLNDARTLSIQLNAGALPVPVKIVRQQDVDATLGADSVQRSIDAGVIGMIVVMIFMILYYRLPGVLASLALITYALVTLAVFKLIPVTLTLAGIAGFILSIGMAVDANILIFERMKEELRAGRTLGAAIEAGFKRAWTSIRDSNVSTIITCVILGWFGSQFGASIVVGFALTLALGVIISMFTAITVSRTFLRSIVGIPAARNMWLFGLERREERADPGFATGARLSGGGS